MTSAKESDQDSTGPRESESPGSSHSPVILLCLLASAVTIKPLAHIVANYARSDRHKETDQYFHRTTPSCCQYGERQHSHYTNFRQAPQVQKGKPPHRTSKSCEGAICLLYRRTVRTVRAVSALLKSCGFGCCKFNALAIRPGVFRPTLIHDAGQHQREGRPNGREYYCPAGQGTGVLVPDAQNGQNKAPCEASDKEQYKKKGELVCEAQRSSRGLSGAFSLSPRHHTRPNALAWRYMTVANCSRVKKSCHI